jgi:TonB-dependent receptor
MKSLRQSLLLGALFLSLGQLLSAADTSSAGSISGRIYNPRTGEYVRNAEVQIEGTQISAVSEEDGSYRIDGVPAGNVVLNIRYTGYAPVRDTLVLQAGKETVHNVQMSVSADKDEPIMLGVFVVSSEREGNAKAIMSQRNSMNITNSVASDVFGDVAEGNIGEFLKNMPGVELDTVEGDIRTVRLRGLGAEYTSVTVDGVALSSSDANTGSSSGSRAFSFEQVSLNSMDSIEVSKTSSADMDANAPAGTINLKTKRAFDRGGRRISWQANMAANSAALSLGESYGMGNSKTRKILPGGIFEYSDVFLNKKLGIILNVSESNVYSVSSRSTMTYNYGTTTADQRPVVPSTIAQVIGPRTTERFTTTLTVDYKAMPKLNVGFTYIYNYSDLYFNLRTATFTNGSRSAVVGDEPLVSFKTTGTGSSLTIANQAISKQGETQTFLPKFEYKMDNLNIEGRFAYSDSKSSYNPMGQRDTIFSSGSLKASGVTYQATRSSANKADWQIAQLSGGDWSSGASFTTPTITVNDGRHSRTRIGSGMLDGTFKLDALPMIVWKTGIKGQRDTRDYQLERENSLYTYTGPGSGTGAWKNYALPYSLDLDLIDAGNLSSTGGQLFVPDTQMITTLFREHPEYFTRSMTASNYYNTYVTNYKHYIEEITAAYLMGTAKLGKAQLRLGFRGEKTQTDSLEPDPLSEAEMTAAGYPTSGGKATTVAGMQYQYFTNPFVHRRGDYAHFFPSASVKYHITSNLDFQVGYSRTIRRPDFQDVAGVWLINEDSLTVSAPNTGLKPEISDNVSARLAYYFEPVGLLAANVYQNSVKGLYITSQMTAEQYGYSGDRDLSNYTFSTTTSGPDRTLITGVELEYSQSLSFLPHPLSGLNVRASYTHNEADSINPNMAPNTVSTGLNYTIWRVNTYANYNWVDNTPINATGANYRRHRSSLDIGASIKLHRNLSLFISARNVLNAPYINMQKMNANTPATAINYAVFGTAYTVGVRGSF